MGIKMLERPDEAKQLYLAEQACKPGEVAMQDTPDQEVPIVADIWLPAAAKVLFGLITPTCSLLLPAYGHSLLIF